MKKQRTIPRQRTGTSLDTSQSAIASSLADAQRVFNDASERLLNVNSWHEFAGPLSAKFQLTDNAGNELSRQAQEGDYLRISIPAPGLNAGAGYDWARVEAQDNFYDRLRDAYVTSLRVRPAPSPLNNNEDVAHFFKGEATSTFLVERTGNRVTASIHGRNELPNTDMHKGADNLRNAIVARGAVSGFSKLQWNSLVDGLLAGLL